MKKVYKVKIEAQVIKHMEYVIAYNVQEVVAIIEANYGSSTINDIIYIKVLGEALNAKEII